MTDERRGAVPRRQRLPVNGESLATVARAMVPSPASVLRQLPFPLRAPSVPDSVEPPEKVSLVGADFPTEWARGYVARMARVLLVEGVLRPSMAAVAAPIVLGLDRLAGLQGPVVFAANHHSHIDTPLLQSVIPEPWRHHMVIGAAADYFFPNRVAAVFSALVIGAVPIERTKISRKSADDAAALVEQGWSFVIFPEGGRSPDGWGQAFHGGAAYLSVRCSVPVVPIHLAGTGRILPKGSSIPKFSVTRVTFGAPLRAAEGESSRKFSNRIEEAVAALGDEGATDWYSARKRLHAGRTPSLRGPSAGEWRKTWSLGDRSPIRRRPTRAWPR